MIEQTPTAEIRDRRVTPEYWDGFHIGDPRIPLEPTVTTGMEDQAHETVLRHIRASQSGEHLARFMRGTTFKGSKYNPNTIVSLDIESLKKDVDPNMQYVLRPYDHRYWGAIVPLSSRDANKGQVIIAFQQISPAVTVDGYSVPVTISKEQYQVVQADYKIGDIWRQEGGIFYGESIHRARSIDVHTLGTPPPKDGEKSRRIIRPRIFSPLWGGSLPQPV